MSGFWQQFGKRDGSDPATDTAVSSPASGLAPLASSGDDILTYDPAPEPVHTGPYHDGLDYLSVMRMIRDHIRPRSYLEIGTNTGDSLTTQSCDAICIDPTFLLTGNPTSNRRRTLMFQMGSDEFFAAHSVRDHFKDGVDLAFLDGMHRFEFLLRDFINVERSANPRSLILIHDCLPLNARMAERIQRTDPNEPANIRSFWTGDVWRILPALKKYRPDLRVRLLDSPPTGLIAVSNLDPTSDVLHQNYHAIVDEFMAVELGTMGIEALWTMFPMIDTKAQCTEGTITATLSTW